jgi:redox-sensitive bicupin YhaK (pirin superfamily)
VTLSRSTLTDGSKTVALVLEGALELFDSAGNTGVNYTGDAQ